MTKVTKCVTDEYHEGYMAYTRGWPLTANPHLKPNEKIDKQVSSGAMWYWIFGWQDALATDMREIKEMIITAATTNTNGRTH